MGWRPTGRILLSIVWLVVAYGVHSGTARAEEILVAIDMNGQVVSDGDLVDQEGDRIVVPIDLARRLRLRLPAKPGDRVTLSDLPGVRARLDPLSQTLYLDVDPKALERTEIGGFLTNQPYDETTTTGLFANYTALLQGGSGSLLATGLFDLGLFSPNGTITSDLSASNTQGIIRLQSHYGRELDGGDTLTIGDGFLFPGAIGQSFPYAGVGLTSRTSANGGRASTPVQSILGQAALPSTVDVYVNNALQSRQTIDAGPFAIQDLPTVTGQGDVRVVVRDVLGREQVITRSFYGSTRLLAPDAEEYGFEMGALRENYGVTNFDYAEPFAAGTWRHGLSSDVTTELHAEASEKRQVLGGQNSLEVGSFGVAHIGGALSQSRGREGQLLTAGLDSQFGPLTLGVSTELAGGHFTELGYNGDRTQRESSAARASLDLGTKGSIDLSVLRFRIEGQALNTTVAAGYSLSIGSRAFIEFSVSDNVSQHDVGGLLTISIPLGGGATASVSTTRSGGKLQTELQANSPIQNDQGFGYDGTIQRGVSDRAEAGGSYRNSFTDLTAHVGTFNGAGVGQVTASGAVEWIGGQVYASRQTNGGFALVDTGEPGIHVTLDHQDQGVTDADGYAFVPRLRPGEVNRIEIDPQDVPLDAVLPETEHDVVPRTSTGYVVPFPIHHQRSATATLVGADGKPLPLSTPYRIRRTGAGSIVGRDGVIYLDDVTEGDVIEAEPPAANGAGARCSVQIHLPASTSAQYQLGDLACR
jgi:outer membrane usher protein